MFAMKPTSIILMSFVAFACGSDQQQIVKSFSYDLTDNVLTLGLEFNQNIEMNTQVNIPILDYGSITLTPPANGKGFVIGGTLNMNYINDGRIVTLNKTRNLPNGQAMPVYVNQDLAQIRIRDSDMIYSDVYLGMDTNHMYLGTALELGYIDQHFPAGLAISFTIEDKQKRPVGVITIYGPNVQNGQLVAPGGFFFATNVTDLIGYYGKQPTTIHPTAVHDLQTYSRLVNVNKQYSKIYSNPFKVQKVLEQFRQMGKDAGYVD